MSSKFSTSYNNKRVIQIKESTKSPIRQVMDTISPLLTVLGIFLIYKLSLKFDFSNCFMLSYDGQLFSAEYCSRNGWPNRHWTRCWIDTRKFSNFYYKNEKASRPKNREVAIEPDVGTRQK